MQKKVLRIIVLLVFYFAILTAISYLRAPVTHTTDQECGTLITYQDFAVWEKTAPNEAYATETFLVIDSPEAVPNVFAAELDLTDVKQLEVSFSVDCQEEFAGANLYVDLMADNYDSDEQEFVVALSPGANRISQIIDKTEDTPSKIYLRFYTLDAVSCTITDLQVLSAEPVSYQGPITSALIVAGFMGLMFIALIFLKKRS